MLLSENHLTRNSRDCYAQKRTDQAAPLQGAVQQMEGPQILIPVSVLHKLIAATQTWSPATFKLTHLSASSARHTTTLHSIRFSSLLYFTTVSDFCFYFCDTLSRLPCTKFIFRKQQLAPSFHSNNFAFPPWPSRPCKQAIFIAHKQYLPLKQWPWSSCCSIVVSIHHPSPSTAFTSQPIHHNVYSQN